MSSKIRWGVLGAARIARVRVIPAIQASTSGKVTALASRDIEKARSAAADGGIDRAYGSYEELLADPDVDAIYNPLPNHLHVPWSIRAAEAGKHVLCEKPIGLSAEECRQLMEARDRTGVCIGEAFMVRSHPQWRRARELVRGGAIGDLRCVIGTFSYFNNDPDNVRSVPEWGGGALLDIGCYPVQIARFLYGEEPLRVTAMIERDPVLKIDRLTTGLLEFASGHAMFTCGTQMVPHQRVQIIGSKARLEMQIPFNAPPDWAARISIDPGQDVFGTGTTFEDFPVCNQYTAQADGFCAAIRDGTAPPTPLEDSLGNMRTIDALFRAAREHTWIPC